MAELVSIKRNVDVSPGQAAPAVFHCSQGDVGSKIILGLLNNGTAYAIPSGVTVTIEGSESNGSIFTPISATVSGSDITFYLTGEMTAVAGPAICQAVLKSGSNILGTANFTLEVESSPMGADAPPVFTDAGWTWMLNKLTTEFVPALDDNIIDAIDSKANQSDLTALSNTVTGHTGSITVLNNTVNTLNHDVRENRQNIALKLDKNQGTANAGKYLKVGADGNVEAAATDTTLSVSGEVADAKAVGDELDYLKTDNSKLKSGTIQGLGQNLNSDTGSMICSNDLNNLPRNIVYGFVPYDGLANVPYTGTGTLYGGLILTLSKQQAVNATMTQMIFRRDGHIFTRQYWGDTYGDWREYKTAAEIETAIAEINSTITNTTGYEVISLVSNTQVNTGTTIGVVKQIVQESSNDTDSLIADCSPGDVFLITAQGWTSYRTYAFIDSSSTILSMSENGEALTNMQVIAPTNAAKIVVNAKRSVSPRYVFRLASWLVNKAEFAPTGQNIISSTVSAICSGDANNIPNNNIYGINIAYDAISNMPFAPRGVNGTYQGTLYTFGKQKARGYGDIQCYISSADDCGSYVRNYTSNWSAWKPVNEQTWKNVLGIGDSICEGWRNENRGFAGMLGVPYRNLGITGATLGVASGHTQIYTEIKNETIMEDLIIADGGINDYYFDVPLGTLPTKPVTNDTDAEALDKTTVSGGLAYLLYLIIKKAPFAQRYFLITHKTKNYPYVKNVSDGYTQQELHDRIVAICKLYNFKIIDVYEDSVINSEFDVYKSPTAYSDSNTGITKQYYVDKDGIHPLALGYQAGYLPVMMRELQRANMT